MSSLVINHRGEKNLSNQAFRYLVKYQKDGKPDDCPHDNFASCIGEGLYAAHDWIQNKWGLAPDAYEIASMVRVLRLHNKQYDTFQEARDGAD